MLTGKDIFDQAQAPVPWKVLSIEGEDAARILATMLHGLQSSAQLPGNRLFINNSSETTHRKGL